MDKFIDTYEPSKLNQEDASNVNRSLTSSETEAVAKPLSIKEALGLSESLLNSFFKTNTNHLKQHHQKKRERTLGNSFNKVSTALSPKLARARRRNKTKTSFPDKSSQ